MSELLTVAEVASLLKCSEETVTRRFAREKGVIDLSSSGNSKRRRYRVLRIPRTVVERYALMRGGRIHVEPTPVTLKTSRAKPVATEDDITSDLAILATQQGAMARQTLERIARRAKAMTHVPKDRWQDMVWLDEDDV